MCVYAAVQRQYLLTLQVSRYRLLSLQSSMVYLLYLIHVVAIPDD